MSRRGQRVAIGARFGRWTVVGYVAPIERRAACSVECVCGAEATMQERRLKSGRSTGCASQRCRHRHEVLEEIRAEVDAMLDRLPRLVVFGE